MNDAHARLVEAIEHSESVESKWSVLRTMRALATIHADAGGRVRCGGLSLRVRDLLRRHHEGIFVVVEADQGRCRG